MILQYVNTSEKCRISMLIQSTLKSKAFSGSNRAEPTVKGN